jgi:hypothetical protein
LDSDSAVANPVRVASLSHPRNAVVNVESRASHGVVIGVWADIITALKRMPKILALGHEPIDH